MSDDRDIPAGFPPAPPPLAGAAPPPLAAAPPPLAAEPPAPPACAPSPPQAPVAYPQAKQPPWAWIAAGLFALALAAIAILYFTGVIGGARTGTLTGTWSPSCTTPGAQALVFTSDSRVLTPGGEATWTRSGDTITITSATGAGPQVVLRWESLDSNRARVTEAASGQSSIMTRCG